MQLDLLATSTFGLEAVVVRELAALGYEAKSPTTGRIAFRGDAAAVARANLWLRAADRVLIRIGQFEARDFEALYQGVYALPWERWIGPSGAFPVSGRSVKSQLSSVPAVQRTVKKAMVMKLMDAHRARQLPESGATTAVEVSLLHDQATLTIDTTGEGLHKRGYRDLTGSAPLRETLAAALVELSFWRPDRPLIDPFCGTGTICIEAAMIGRNIAPGLRRSFAAEHWGGEFDAALWERERAAARQAIRPALEERIIGTDIDEAALSMARRHAERAGVAGDIHFQTRPFAELSSKKQYGCVITNPPYGMRVEEESDVQALYRSMPLVLRRLGTWSFFILTSWPEFESLVGRRADRRRKLFNGPIECTYYQFHGPRPGEATTDEEPPSPEADEAELAEPLSASPATARTATQVFGGLTAKAHEQAEVLANRLKKMDRHRRRWPKRGITCYRVYNRDIPDIPLMIDRYEDCLHISEYQRPHDRTDAQQADWLDLMVRTAGQTLGVPKHKTFVKHRERQRGLSQYERAGDRGYTLIAHEGGLKFEVNLSDYVDTGLFLDHRITRSMVRDESRGKRALNLFGYTGAFSVYAAAGGARQVTTVDLSNTYLDWARRNFELNGFPSASHRFVRADAMAFIEGHRKVEGGAYDLAVVDPPTFSTSKGMEGVWDVQRHHAELLNGLIGLMSPGGVIYFSTNFRRFKLEEEKLRDVSITEITSRTVPEDFANKRTHRCWRMVVGSGS